MRSSQSVRRVYEREEGGTAAALFVTPLGEELLLL
jgi:hypothetical protein